MMKINQRRFYLMLDGIVHRLNIICTYPTNDDAEKIINCIQSEIEKLKTLTDLIAPEE